MDTPKYSLMDTLTQIQRVLKLLGASRNANRVEERNQVDVFLSIEQQDVFQTLEA